MPVEREDSIKKFGVIKLVKKERRIGNTIAVEVGTEGTRGGGKQTTGKAKEVPRSRR